MNYESRYHPSMAARLFTIAGVLVLLQRCQKVTSSDQSFGKNATQSGNFYDSRYTSAHFAVDGDSATCSIASTADPTYSGDKTFAWWQVDLGDFYVVDSVSVISSTYLTNAYYLTNFAVFVGNSTNTHWLFVPMCGYFSNSTAQLGQWISITCSNQPLIGRYVTIERQGGIQPNSLTLCEVNIYGYKYIGDGDAALNKPTSQSIGLTQGKVVLDSSRAVDGDLANCAVPWSSSDSAAWWSVDLQGVYHINSVTVYNMNSESIVKLVSSTMLADFAVKVGNTSDISSHSLCASQVGPIAFASGVVLSCLSPISGRYVSIQKKSNNTSPIYGLVICEVVVSVGSASSLPLPTSTTTPPSPPSRQTSPNALAGEYPSSSCTDTFVTSIVLGVLLVLILIVIGILVFALSKTRYRLKEKDSELGRSDSGIDGEILRKRWSNHDIRCTYDEAQGESPYYSESSGYQSYSSIHDRGSVHSKIFQQKPKTGVTPSSRPASGYYTAKRFAFIFNPTGETPSAHANPWKLKRNWRY